jgi:Domain of unknown function (DUF6968)
MELGTIIASRIYEVLGGGSATLSIGLPRSNPEAPDWFYPWQLVGAGDGAVHAAYGIDAVQALQLAMPDIGSHLARLPDLRLDGGRDLGFPTPDEWLAVSEYRRRRDGKGGTSI